MRRASLSLLTLALIALPCAGGCRQTAEDEQQLPASTPQSTALPALDLRDDTPHLLLTWLDPKGDFHVVQKISEVPPDARERVRVVQTTREEGTGQVFYVANLTAKQPNGTYPVTTMTRAQWDEIGAERRKERLEALAPRASASTSPSKVKPGEVTAVIYGAEWCRPCHDAERYLEAHGATVEMKDIEKDALARAELERKLKRANLPNTAQMPIIDIDGQLLVGFSPSALEGALRNAETAETL